MSADEMFEKLEYEKKKDLVTIYKRCKRITSNK